MSFAGKWDGIREHHVKPGSEDQRSHVFPHMWKLDLKDKCIPNVYVCVYDCNSGSV
jgi:hypothetical protein